eukprot:1393014-Pyramimonas_sp.AAC.1
MPQGETLVLRHRLSSPGGQNSEELQCEMLVFTRPGLEDFSSETLGFTPPGCPGRGLAPGFVEDVSSDTLGFTRPRRPGGCLA